MSIDTGEGAPPQAIDSAPPSADVPSAADTGRSLADAEFMDVDEESLTDDDDTDGSIDPGDSSLSDPEPSDAAEESLHTGDGGCPADNQLTDAELSDATEEALDEDGVEAAEPLAAREVDDGTTPSPTEANGEQAARGSGVESDSGSDTQDMQYIYPSPDRSSDSGDSTAASDTTETSAGRRDVRDVTSEPASAAVDGEITDQNDAATGSDQQLADHDTSGALPGDSKNATEVEAPPSQVESAADNTGPVGTNPESILQPTSSDSASDEPAQDPSEPEQRNADKSDPSSLGMTGKALSFIEEMLTTEHGADVIGFIDREVFRNPDAIRKGHLDSNKPGQSTVFSSPDGGRSSADFPRDAGVGASRLIESSAVEHENEATATGSKDRTDAARLPDAELTAANEESLDHDDGADAAGNSPIPQDETAAARNETLDGASNEPGSAELQEQPTVGALDVSTSPADSTAVERDMRSTVDTEPEAERPLDSQVTVDIPQAPQAITGYSEHGGKNAQERDGHGVSDAAIEDAVKNPIKPPAFESDKHGGNYKYVGNDAIIVLNLEGKVVTTWARSSAGWRHP